MQDGISALEWEISPLRIEYDKEFLKLARSEEAMKEVRRKWAECLQETKTEIARRFIHL